MLLPILLATPALAQGPEPIPPTPYDRVVELGITPDDEPAIEGHGPTVVVEYEVEFDGTLHVWTTSELDLFLQVDDAAEARQLASDDNSGGGTTPYLALDVKRGDWLAVLVAGEPGATGPLTLHLVAAPKSEAGHLAEMAAQAALRESARLVREGSQAQAREVTAMALAEVMDTIVSDSTDLILARVSLARTMEAMGDFTEARPLWESVLASYERILPGDHPDLVSARDNMAASMETMGDLAGARALRESVLASLERILPEDHPALLLARGNLAVSISQMGDLAGARALRESVLASCEGNLPDDHPLLIAARGNLSNSIEAEGDLAGARTLREAVLAACERTLPEDHPDLLAARANLANSMGAMGDLAGARALRESVLAACERTLPEDHSELLSARVHLAGSMGATGDLAGARALKESVVAAYERSLPEDHPDRLFAQASLAVSMWKMGDLVGARAMCESVLMARERALSEDHPKLILAQANLAVVMESMGDSGGARTLRESILAARKRTLPEDHPDLLLARSYVAASMHQAGDFGGARVLFESVLAASTRVLPEDHPDILSARTNLAASMSQMGDIDGARILRESVLSVLECTLPEDHPDLLHARANLGVLMSTMGDLVGARALLPKLVMGMRARVLASLALAPRQARQTVASESQRHSEVLFLSESAGATLERSVFELTETMRLVAAEAARSLARFEADPELAPILGEAAGVRRTLNDLVVGAARDETGSEGMPAELTRLSLRRDALEREASRRLAERGVVTGPVGVSALTAALDPGDVAIGYRRITLKRGDPSNGEIEAAAEHLLAHVLDAEGRLSRIDLGAASELEELAREWRAALGAPVLRGIGVEAREDDSEARVGRELCARILDPVLALAGEQVERLFICADDLLYLLPLDALPFDTSYEETGDEAAPERIGDRLRIVNEVSFARLLAPVSPADTAPSLLAFGGVDYDADGAVPEGLIGSSAPIEAGDGADPDDSETAGSASRSAVPERFQKLLQARLEAEATVVLFKDTFEVEPTLLTGKKTTKAALFESAVGKRYVHLATHGWFAPESVRSSEDAQPEPHGFPRMGIEERVAGLAPMTLCGLALAGANKGRDTLGRVPGILTAEELCSLDLDQCELAVLSACETNVGIRRAGQGIQSLQSALYAAGARTSITSLWNVDDAATRRLFEVFYRSLWIEKMGKADALWRAKMALRDQGYAVRDWAGWVLTGDPD